MELHIKTKTWTRDSHSLFDYESRSVLPKSLNTVTSCKVIRNESNVQLSTKRCEKIVGNIEVKKGDFFVAAGSGEGLWLIVRLLKFNSKSGCVLHEGDTIKLGRVQLHVKTLKAAGGSDSTFDSDSEELREESGTCKVCLSAECEPANPLISPCTCAGSVKHIHLECLQK